MCTSYICLAADTDTNCDGPSCSTIDGPGLGDKRRGEKRGEEGRAGEKRGGEEQIEAQQPMQRVWGAYHSLGTHSFAALVYWSKHRDTRRYRCYQQECHPLGRGEVCWRIPEALIHCHHGSQTCVPRSTGMFCSRDSPILPTLLHGDIRA